MNQKLKLITGLLAFILSIQFTFASSDNKTRLSASVTSREDSTQIGTITFDLVIHAKDTVIIDSIGGAYTYFSTISNNGSFPIFLDSSDSIVIQITLTYNSGNLPYYYKSVDNYIFSHKDSLYSTHIAPCNIYFTPYGTTEVWNPDDFSGLKRAWILPDSIEPTRVFISRDSIPVSDRVDLDSLHEQWEENYQYISYPGLPYMVEMKAIHPDSLKKFIMEYDEFYLDSIGDPTNVTLILAKRFKGTVRGRLTSDYINDLDQPVTDRIPLAGIHVILKCNQKVRIGANDIYTNDNGEFEVDYDVVSFFDGDKIELYLEFETKSKFETKVKRKGSTYEENPYVETIELGSKEDATLTEVPEELTHFNGERSYPFRIASWTYLAYRFFEDNASDFLPDWELKIKLHYSDPNQGSHYRSVQRNIYLEDGDDRHETVIWHEYGHYVMNFLTGNANKGGGPHNSRDESDFQTAWSEGWATGFMSILDVYYRELDEESGTYGFFERGVDPSGIFIGRTEIELRNDQWFRRTNGIRSEYLISCTLNDLYDGPSHISNANNWNDDANSNPTGYTNDQIDDLELNPTFIFEAMENNPKSVTSFYFFLINNSGLSCDERSKIFKIFDQNRVRFNGRSLSPDEIGVFETFDDFLTFDPEIWDWINPNLISLNMRLNRDISIESTNDFSFNLAPLFTLSGHKFINRNLNVTNDGILFINKNSSYGWVNGTSNGEIDGTPVANSTVLVDVCKSRINIRFGGSLIVGDENGTNTGNISFNEGSILSTNFNNWTNISKIIINDNSKLVIQEGAVLEYYPGTEIILNGPNAVLEIKGQIQLMNGATFAVSGGSAGLGYIKFFKNANSGPEALIISPNNDGKIELIGTSSTDKLIEIDGTEGLKLNSDIIDFTIKQAKVLLGDRSSIEPNVSGKVFFESVKIDQLFNDYEHNGIRINGVKNEFHLVTVTGGNYGFVNTGLIIGNEKLNLRAVHIVECSIGIMTYSSGINYLGGLIKGYSIAGWKSVGANVPSDITGVWFNNDQSNSGVFGVLLDGVNSAGSSTFTGSKFQSNASGIQTWNVPVRLKSCNYFESNDIGIQMEAWSNLDLSNNSYTTFNGNDMHILSRFHGIMHMNDGHNGFLSSGNSSIFWASLQPGAQSPSVTYLTLAPTPENYYANNNFFQTTPSWGNNFYLDERGSRVLNLTTNNFYPNNNPSVWTSAQNNVCGTPDYETLEFTGSGGGLGQFIVSKYSSLSGVTIPSGMEYGNNLLTVCSGLIDSLYMADTPNYTAITCGLGHLARKTYSNNSSVMANFKLELMEHAIKAYAIGVSRGLIFVSEDSLAYASNCLLNTLDTLLIDANNDSLPWKNNKFSLSASKAEVYRIAEHRDDASMYLNSALSVYTDSLEQIYLNKWACIIEAEQAFIDSLVTLDSLYINYPCFGQEIEFSAPMLNTSGIDDPTKKKEELKNSMFVYPNPASDLLKIVLNNKQEIVKIVICDLKGMVLYSSEISAQNSETEIDLSAFSSGSYVISVMSDKAVFHSPLIISK